MSARLSIAIWLLAIALAPPEAGAQAPEVDLELVDPAETEESGDEGEEAEDEAGEPGLPWFRAVITARPGLVEKDFVLHQLDAETPLAIRAKKSSTFEESDQGMSLVVLIQGNYRWMGNESHADPEGEEAVYQGAFSGLGPAIEALAAMGPADSRGALLVYGDGVEVKAPMGEIGAVAGALGSQRDYSAISTPLVAGLTEAWKLFVKPEESGRRKVLVVLGSGVGEGEATDAGLRKVIGDLKKAEVETYAIHYFEATDQDPQGQQNMKKIGYSGSYHAGQRNAFATHAGSIAELVGAKYYVDFPGDEVAFDGTEHEFVVKVDGEEGEPALLQLPERQTKEEGGSLWWLWLLLILVLLILIIVIVVVVKRKKEQPAPQPMPEEMPPPQPAAPQKTVMLGVGGSEDAMPIVGWVVPLGGPNQYQTFKLLQGSTKLGTGGQAHIVVGDGYMSTEHAEVVCSATGFVLNDLGSTNGTLVNDQRVTTHELVDNDVFRLGQTDFKFKSIN